MVDETTSPEEEMAKIASDEAALSFTHFDTHTAWEVGCWLRAAAAARKLAVLIDVYANGMSLFQAALPGARPDSAEWIRRKRNLTLRMHTSSRMTELRLAQAGTTLEVRTGAPSRDFAAAGGSVPIRINGVGVIGAVTVSGLTGQADHALATEALFVLHLATT